MPVSLPPIIPDSGAARPSRRRFLAGSLSAAAGLLLPAQLPALLTADVPATRPATDPDRFALLSDIHIAANHRLVYRGVNMFDNMLCASIQVIDRQPAAVFIDGDLAFRNGSAQDYTAVVASLDPMRRAGLPLLLTLGNHDRREHFWAALPGEDPARVGTQARPLRDHQAMVFATPRANWFILDSLKEPNLTTGLVGVAQLKWLASALDRTSDKPALVMVHHNPDRGLIVAGLRDTAALMNVIQPRKQVKALIFGHTHDWSVKQENGLHLINLPPVSYVFWPGRPNGWVEATMRDNGMTLRLHCLDGKNKLNEQTVKLEWRA